MDDYTNSMPPQTSGLAIASLVLGILAFFTCGMTAIIGLILGIVAMYIIAGSQGQVQGRGMAVAGIALSAVGMVVGLGICVAIMMPALTKARGQAQTMVVMNNGRQLGLSMIMYADDNSQQFPDPNSWTDKLTAYNRGVQMMLTAPPTPSEGRIWAMNASLNGLKTGDIVQPHRVVMLYECKAGSPAAGGPELLCETPRSYRGHIIVFADGHLECVKPGAVGRLVWQPQLRTNKDEGK